MSLSSELAAAIEDEHYHFLIPSPPAKSSNDITAVQKMVSACLGSLITSFANTPFDVVRIRIQQQEIMQNAPSSVKSAAKKVAGPTPPGVFWINQTYCEGAHNGPKITSTFQGMMVISRNEGITTLWRGLSLTLLMALPSNIIYFTGYEYIRDKSPLVSHPLNPLFCGMAARTMSATVVSPIELLKTRLQSIPSETHASQPKSRLVSSLIRATFGGIRQNGLGSMFTGLQITLWRDVPFLGIYWLCYEFFKEQLSTAMRIDFDNNKSQQDNWKVFAISFFSGSLGGVISAFFTNPFDVGKTRLQIAERKSNEPRVSMFRFLISIYKKEGVGALYGGFAPRVMKIAPLCAIMISSYEIGKKFFKNTL